MKLLLLILLLVQPYYRRPVADQSHLLTPSDGTYIYMQPTVREMYYTTNKRNIKVKNQEGYYDETPGGDNDNPNWLYRKDGDTWYYSPDNGRIWYKWYDEWWDVGHWFKGWYRYVWGTPYGTDYYSVPLGSELTLLYIIGIFITLKTRK